MAKMAAAANFPKPTMAQLVPTEKPIIPQINDATTRLLLHIINVGLWFFVMPLVSRSIAPKAEKIHAIIMNVRVIINFKHCPRNSLGIPEHDVRLAKHSSRLGSLLDLIQPFHRPVVTDILSPSSVALKYANRLSKNHALLAENRFSIVFLSKEDFSLPIICSRNQIS